MQLERESPSQIVDLTMANHRRSSSPEDMQSTRETSSPSAPDSPLNDSVKSGNNPFSIRNILARSKPAAERIPAGLLRLPPSPPESVLLSQRYPTVFDLQSSLLRLYADGHFAASAAMAAAAAAAVSPTFLPWYPMTPIVPTSSLAQGEWIDHDWIRYHLD